MHNKMPSTNPTKLSKINFQASGTAKVPFARGHHDKGLSDSRQQQFLFSLATFPLTVFIA